MNLTTVRNRTKICTMVALAGTILAGCTTHPAATATTSGQGAALTAQHGQASSGAALPSDATCVTSLMLGWADNGTTHCVRLGARITVGLLSPDLSAYQEIGLTGSSLRLVPAPMPFGFFMYEATSPGTTVMAATQDVCFTSTGTGTCPPVTPWSVTIIVR